jgi:hypothetical protein
LLLRDPDDCLAVRFPAPAQRREPVRLRPVQPEQIFATAVGFGGIDGAIGARGYSYAVQGEISGPLSSFFTFATVAEQIDIAVSLRGLARPREGEGRPKGGLWVAMW